MPLLRDHRDGYLAKRMMRHRHLQSCLLSAILLLSSCIAGNERLNSDRIRQTFGSYGVDVLQQDDRRRVSSLYSGTDDETITRTYAVVDYLDKPASDWIADHERIVAGASIGATFRRSGWDIEKQHLFIGELEIPAAYEDIGRLMHISLPATLATHQYLFVIRREGRSADYARITEIHHPEYLTATDLRSLYGEILFDDSNRDSIHDFIGPPPGTEQ
jgi:hypothetical protein